jgi:hypothetical protein
MWTYRCPKHDVVFDAVTDQRAPGANATATLPAHPVNGHPDCPQCINDAKLPPSRETLVAAARAKAAQAAAKLADAQREATQTAQEVAGVEAQTAVQMGRRIA